MYLGLVRIATLASMMGMESSGCCWTRISLRKAAADQNRAVTPHLVDARIARIDIVVSAISGAHRAALLLGDHDEVQMCLPEISS